MCQVLKRHDRPDIAYIVHQGQKGAPTLLFLCGYRSDMIGSKASALARWVASTPYSLIRFDYSGHGQSGGSFHDQTISDWVLDAQDIIDRVGPTGNIIAVGSSMGGWIALRLALLCRERIQGIIGIAAAPDFTERMAEHDFTTDQRRILATTGMLEVPSPLGPDPYIITQRLIADGHHHCVLTHLHDLEIPMILLQGGKDIAVPATTPDLIIKAFPRAEITVHHIDDGDHGLSRPQDLAVLYQAIHEVADIIYDDSAIDEFFPMHDPD